MTKGTRLMSRAGLHLGIFVAMAALQVGVAAAASDLRMIDAASRDDKAALKSLIAQHADVNAAQPDGTTVLDLVVRADDTESAAALLKAGASAKAANRYGITPLWLAATNGNAEIAQMLLKAGADPNSALPEGETILMTASRAGNAEVVKALLDRDAIVNTTESWQQESALMLAAGENHGDVVKLLIAHGARVNERSRLIPPPSRLAVAGVALQETHTTFPKGGLTPLLFAARQGALSAANALADGGADLNLGDPDGITPMSLAILNGHYDVAAALLAKGADPNVADNAGMTPLYAAVDMHTFEWIFSRPVPRPSGRLDSVDMTKLLLEHKANPNAQLKRRIFAVQHNYVPNPNLGAGATPFLKAASTSDLVLMRMLLEHGADPNLRNKNETTPLMAAAGLNWRDIASIGTEDDSIEAIKLCLEHGADVNAANKLGETALHGAAQRGADTIVKFLVSKGANLNARTERGRTALDDALGQAAVADEEDVRRPERQSTVALLRELMAKQTSATASVK
jgi:ankyrin repeat protein